MDKNIKTVLQWNNIEEVEYFTTLSEARYFLKHKLLEYFDILSTDFSQESTLESIEEFLLNHNVKMKIIEQKVSLIKEV